MTQTTDREPILISRYSSRRLYNTATSEYVTLSDIAELIRAGEEIKIVDKKSGDDITRQYLLQIITEHESRGEQLLPLNILTDIVRSYNEQATSLVPDFLARSFEALKGQQEEVVGQFQKQMSNVVDPGKMAENFQKWQQAQIGMFGAGGNPFMPGFAGSNADEEQAADEPPEKPETAGSDIDEMKRQIAELQKKLDKLP
ncbi:MAG: polyhydroxyalkanoate synthesis repressor PhaR [Rhodobacteraceae bacterium]|nr:polyhydroxyalkanoate synthesis repressor PhaR [Paracoccaceae bacterium]